MLINGHELHVEQYGPMYGPAVILLHHGLGSGRAWREQIPELVENGFHVTTYDRWGYGGSDERPGLDLPTFASDVSDLCAICELLEIKTAALVGHSDGGTIALYYAAQHTAQVSCLVTVAAHIYTEPKMETGMLGVKKAFMSDERFRKGLFNAHGPKYEQVFYNWFEGWYRTEYRVWDMRPVIRRIKCPALIVQGELDEHGTPKHALDIADAILDAEVWIVPGLGHMFPMENPDLFNSRLIQFLKIHAGEPSQQELL